MAKETKFIQVSPSRVEKTIEQWGWFGWELVGAPQEIKTQDVQVYAGQSSDKTTKYYETKKGEHYVKVTFQREKSMPNYAELCDLEKSFYTDKMPEEPGSEPVKPVAPESTGTGCFITLIVITVVFSLWCILALADGKIGMFFFGLIIVIIAISIAISKRKSNSDLKNYPTLCENYETRHAEWQSAHDDWEKKRDEFTKKRREGIERAKFLSQ